jgi:hypothetical protein
MVEVGLPPLTLGLCYYFQQFMPDDFCSYRLFQEYKEEKGITEGRLDIGLYYTNLPETFWTPWGPGLIFPEGTTVVKYENGLGYLDRTSLREVTVFPFYENGEYSKQFEHKKVTPLAFTETPVIQEEQYIGPQRRAYLEWIINHG